MDFRSLSKYYQVTNMEKAERFCCEFVINYSISDISASRIALLNIIKVKETLSNSAAIIIIFQVMLNVLNNQVTNTDVNQLTRLLKRKTLWSGYLHYLVGVALCKINNFDEACVKLLRGLKIAISSGDVRVEYLLKAFMLEIKNEINPFEVDQECIDITIRGCRMHGYKDLEGRLFYLKAKNLLMNENILRELDLYRKTLSLLEEERECVFYQRTIVELAKCFLRNKKINEAEKMLSIIFESKHREISAKCRLLNQEISNYKQIQ